MPMINEEEFRGLKFTETVIPDWSPGSGPEYGMVVWEPLNEGASAIPQRYNPCEEGSLEAARDRIKRTILYCRPADLVKSDDP